MTYVMLIYFPQIFQANIQRTRKAKSSEFD